MYILCSHFTMLVHVQVSTYIEEYLLGIQIVQELMENGRKRESVLHCKENGKAFRTFDSARVHYEGN